RRPAKSAKPRPPAIRQLKQPVVVESFSSGEPRWAHWSPSFKPTCTAFNTPPPKFREDVAILRPRHPFRRWCGQLLHVIIRGNERAAVTNGFAAYQSGRQVFQQRLPVSEGLFPQ